MYPNKSLTYKIIQYTQFIQNTVMILLGYADCVSPLHRPSNMDIELKHSGLKHLSVSLTYLFDTKLEKW